MNSPKLTASGADLRPLRALLASTMAAVGLSAAPLRLYVSPAGNDAWTGRSPEAAAPRGAFATLGRARDEIRRLRAAGEIPVDGVRVELAEGTYRLSETFELTAADSGTADGPIVYRAAEGEGVRLTGGVPITDFSVLDDPALLERLPAAARGQVLRADLRAHGLTEFGEPSGGFGRPSGQFTELFFGERPMTVARWPNDGFVRIVDLQGGQPKDVRGTKGDKAGVFTYSGERPARWVGEKDLWLHGWWFWDWADQRQKVESIDPERKIITLTKPDHGYGYRKGQWYYAFNALAELDRPGEWCIDREGGMLYFWPPADPAAHRAVMSSVLTLVKMTDVSHVTLHGMTLEQSRTTAVVVRGGAGVSIVGCTIRNVGGSAVSMTGSNSGVYGCDIYETGDGGISLDGGDRETLTAGNLTAVNNHIHHFSRWNRILRPGIGLHGVGNRIAHNLIHNAPHMAVMFGGNDHTIEYNEIHSVSYEANDAGAIYAGRDWTMRGHVIRHNYFHHISGFEGRGCVGIYLDDMFSSATITGNIFYDVTRAAFIGGGRDNVIENNIFVDCRPAVHVDARALGWASGSVSTTMTNRLNAMPYRGELWSRRYPKLVGILDDEPAVPRGNVIARNLCWGGRWDEIQAAARKEIHFEDNLVDTGLGALDVTFQLAPGSAAWDIGFEAIPFERIGLVHDEQRASWPVVHTVRPRGTREAAPATEADVAATPVYRVPRAEAPLSVDGVLDPSEWLGLDPSRAMPVAEGLKREPAAPRSTAWLRHDGTYLYVAVDNAVDPGTPLRTEAKWGVNDAVELAFRQRPAAGRSGPIIVFRGYPSGTFESSTEAGASEAQAAAAAKGVAFGAHAVNSGRWTVEWRIPLASLGIDDPESIRIPFSLSVRKTADSLWLLWCGTDHATWNVDRAGVLILE